MIARAIRSFLSTSKASHLFGRACRLRDAGNMEESLRVARQSLDVLRAPWVLRSGAPGASVLVTTTVLVEELASELKQPGAGATDVADALACLKSLPQDSAAMSTSTHPWIPFLESRLEAKINVAPSSDYSA